MQDNECCAHLQVEKKVNGIVVVELEAQVLKKQEVTFQDVAVSQVCCLLLSLLCIPDHVPTQTPSCLPMAPLLYHLRWHRSIGV